MPGNFLAMLNKFITKQFLGKLIVRESREELNVSSGDPLPCDRFLADVIVPLAYIISRKSSVAK